MGKTSEEQFNQQAAHYNAQWNKWSEDSLDWLLGQAPLKATDRVLDVATGTGFTAMAFASRVKEVVGLDVSQAMLDQAARNALKEGLANVTFRKGEAEDLPFPGESFDYVTCRVAPHHFVSVHRFCHESFRVLKAGGRLLIADTSVPEGEPEVDRWQNLVEAIRDTSHVRNYSPHEWRVMTTEAGFHVEALEELKEGAQMGMRDWMKKSGCEGDAASQVIALFADPPDRARRLFRITPQPDGDVTFQWMRVVLVARKP